MKVSRNNNLVYSLLVVFITIAGCEYEPTSSIVSDIRKTPYDTIRLDLMQQADTIIVTLRSEFTYNIECNREQQLYRVNIKINNELIRSSYHNVGSFNIDPENYTSGTYILSLEAITSTGTNSLADISEQEVIQFSKEWILVIDNSPPAILNIHNIAEANGTIKITWPMSKNLNFHSYKIIRNVYKTHNYDGSNHFYNRVLKTIKSAEDTTFYDDSYLGGEVQYIIRNVSMKDSVESSPYSFSRPYPTLTSMNNNHTDTVTVTWTSCRYEHNFGSYQISNFNGSQVISLENIHDTSFTFYLPFGTAYDIKLITQSRKYYDDEPEELSDFMEIYSGKRIPSYSYLVKSNNPNIVYLTTAREVIKYDFILDSILCTFVSDISSHYDETVFQVSPNEQYLAFSREYQILLLDPNNLDVNRTIELANYFSSTTPSALSLSNNGLLSVRFDYEGGIINLETDELLHSRLGNNAYFALSANGTYYTSYESNVLYLNLTSSLEPIAPVEGYFLLFPPDQNNRLFTQRLGANVYEHINSSGQLLHNYEHTVRFAQNDYDPVTQLMLQKDDGNTIHIVNTNLWEEIYTLQVSNYSTYSLINNMLFSNSGYLMNLNR